MFKKYLFALGQTFLTAQFSVAIFHFQCVRCAAGGLIVLRDGQVVHVAETSETGLTAYLVDSVLLYDLMFAL